MGKTGIRIHPSLMKRPKERYRSINEIMKQLAAEKGEDATNVNVGIVERKVAPVPDSHCVTVGPCYCPTCCDLPPPPKRVLETENVGSSMEGISPQGNIKKLKVKGAST